MGRKFKRNNNDDDSSSLQKKLKEKNKKKKNQSPKGNMCSAIPVALLCMVVNRNEKQGSGPKEDKVL